MTTATDKGLRMTSAVTTERALTVRLAELEHGLASMRLRLAITRVAARDISQWVGDDASLDLIIDDVARQWTTRTASDPQVLDGPAGFWSRYGNRIEWGPPDSGNEYRPEFCPADSDALFDRDDYLHAVWAAHAAQLRAGA